MLINQDDLEKKLDAIDEHLHNLLIDIVGQLDDLESKVTAVEEKLDEVLEARKSENKQPD